MVVVLPDTTGQVVEVLRYCPANGVKVVPRGAGTSLSGGALPLEDGIVLGLGKFNRILEIDYDNRCVVVQPGVTNLAHHPGGAGARASITPRIPPARSPAPSAAMSPRTPAACTASSTALTTNNVLGVEMVTDGRRDRAPRRQASRCRRATICSASSSAPRACSASSPR